MNIIIRVFKKDLIIALLCGIIDSTLKISISVLILYLFTAVSQSRTVEAFIEATVICLICYLAQLSKQQCFLYSYILASRIKSGLAMLLYGKISYLSSYMIKSTEIGKITNLLASDLGIIEMRLATFISSFTFPVTAIGSTILLITRLGWPGVLGIVLVILSIPLSNFISKRNGKLIQEINVFKDKRIQITTEVIEGIKFIKLYGW